METIEVQMLFDGDTPHESDTDTLPKPSTSTNGHVPKSFSNDGIDPDQFSTFYEKLGHLDKKKDDSLPPGAPLPSQYSMYWAYD